jgi:hypothetical protein
MTDLLEAAAAEININNNNNNNNSNSENETEIDPNAVLSRQKETIVKSLVRFRRRSTYYTLLRKLDRKMNASKRKEAVNILGVNFF